MAYAGQTALSGVRAQWLDAGRRLHLQHGPIDLVIQANGETKSVSQAYTLAQEAFADVLNDLVAEIIYLKQTCTSTSVHPKGAVARRMVGAAQRCASLHRVTPMIAVAGSVADHVLDAMLAVPSLSRVSVNNGGDIALWLAENETYTIGIVDNVVDGVVSSTFKLSANQSINGIATSGWRGRSHSLGIADAVTVLANNAACADAAATIIANAVDLPNSPSVHRMPANELSPDSDLGLRLVTVAVDALTDAQIQLALRRGYAMANELLSKHIIVAAYLSLAGVVQVCDKQSQLIDTGAMHA